MRWLQYGLLYFILSLTVPAWAVDHNNLDEGHPLRVEDAYPLAYGELSTEVGVQAHHPRHGTDRVSFPLELLYGAYWNLHVGIGTTLSTQPHSMNEGEKSGDVRIFGLYNVNQETLRLPALATKVSVTLPTGIDARRTDIGLMGIVTRSLSHGRIHLNVGYAFHKGAQNRGRSGEYEVVLGGQYPLAYPRSFTTSLLADVFTQPSPRVGGKQVTGVEVGIRHQVAPLTVVDMGIGSEVTGPSDRAIFFAIVGVSVGF